MKQGILFIVCVTIAFMFGQVVGYFHLLTWRAKRVRKKTMIRTACITIAVLAVTPALAQTTTCITTRDAISGAYISQCTPNQGGITHRYNPEAERAFRAEQNYYDRAYDYELRRLDQENRR